MKMKREKCIVLITVAISIAFCGCRKKEVLDETDHRYICIVPPQEKYYWGEVKEGIAQADKYFGCNTKIETFEIFDLDEQMELLEQTTSFHTDGIITVGQPQSKEICSLLEVISNSGVPVVLLDTDADEELRNAYVGSNNEEAGELAAEKILENVEGEVRAVIVVSELNNANQKERVEGFEDVLDESGRGIVVETIESKGDTLSLQDQLTQLWKRSGESEKPNVIFCGEASTTQSTGLFLEKHDETIDVLAIGFDQVGETIGLVENGVLFGTIVQKAEEIGFKAIETLEEKNRGEEILEKIYTDVRFAGAGGME